MKKQNLLFIVILLLAFILNKLNAQTVNVTESGKKYHIKNCSIAKIGKKGMELVIAKKEDFEAYKVYKPNEIVTDKTKKQRLKSSINFF